MTKRSGSSRGARTAGGKGAYLDDDYLHNHVVSPGRASALREFVGKEYGGMKHKVANARSSNSEDALTWSCFDALRQVSSRPRQAALRNLWELAYGPREIPAGVLDGKIGIGEVFRPGNVDSRGDEKTEVDVSIEGENVLVFFEAKLYSPMSQADRTVRRRDQIAHKLRVGVREATRRSEQSGREVDFHFLLLDIAPARQLRQQSSRATLDDASEKRSGFGGKWVTAYWFDRYKYGRSGSLAPLERMLASSPAVDGATPSRIAANMGWLTWADVFKEVLRAVMADDQRER